MEPRGIRPQVLSPLLVTGSAPVLSYVSLQMSWDGLRENKEEQGKPEVLHYQQLAQKFNYTWENKPVRCQAWHE